ncbi:MAG: cbb3-type cytochrome oxidase subunit 3 [Crocinitomicaceae bacterium]|jgi:cbb3-type cytochrome oxidase subunit 3
MNKLILVSILLAIIFPTQLFSQDIQTVNIKAGEFPNYSGELIVRDPSGIDSSEVVFMEGDSVLNVEFESGRFASEAKGNKSVLILVLNHQAHRKRTKWYQNVIKSAINDGLIKEGDEFAIQSFDCNRPEYGSVEKQLLYPGSPVFVGTNNDLISQVNGIDLTLNRHRNNCQTKGDIYGAIYEALEAYNKVKTDLPKSIVVMADDWSVVEQVKEQGITNRASNYNIAVYGVTFYINIKRDYGIGQVCKDTYGEFFIDKSNDISLASEAFIDFGNQMYQRSQGVSYPFNFNSPFPKDGKSHAVKVSHKNQVSVFKYESPSMSMMEWMGKNPLLTGGIAFLFVLLAIVLVVLSKKKKKANAEKERLRQEEIRKVEEQQKAAGLKVAQQDAEINRMKDSERQKEQGIQDKKAAEKKAEEDLANLQLMSAKGSLPWLSFEYQGNTGNFELNAPEFTVGRDEINNYKINLPIVSRQHFKIEFKAGGYMLTDLESSNGTVVNGNRVSTTIIKHGDVISIGDVHLTFHV